jgi:hypothetical protein
MELRWDSNAEREGDLTEQTMGMAGKAEVSAANSQVRTQASAVKVSAPGDTPAGLSLEGTLMLGTVILWVAVLFIWGIYSVGLYEAGRQKGRQERG